MTYWTRRYSLPCWLDLPAATHFPKGFFVPFPCGFPHLHYAALTQYCSFCPIRRLVLLSSGNRSARRFEPFGKSHKTAAFLPVLYAVLPRRKPPASALYPPHKHSCLCNASCFLLKRFLPQTAEESRCHCHPPPGADCPSRSPDQSSKSGYNPASKPESAPSDAAPASAAPPFPGASGRCSPAESADRTALRSPPPA